MNKKNINKKRQQKEHTDKSDIQFELNIKLTWDVNFVLRMNISADSHLSEQFVQLADDVGRRRLWMTEDTTN